MKGKKLPTKKQHKRKTVNAAQSNVRRTTGECKRKPCIIPRDDQFVCPPYNSCANFGELQHRTSEKVKIFKIYFHETATWPWNAVGWGCRKLRTPCIWTNRWHTCITRRSLTANSICFLVWAEPVNYLWNDCAETSPVCLKTKKTNKHISTKSLHSDKHGSSFPGVSNIPTERLDNWGAASSHWVTEALLLSMRPGLNGCGHEACSQSHTLWNPPKTIPKKKRH